jgi:hypothetical protein
MLCFERVEEGQSCLQKVNPVKENRTLGLKGVFNRQATMKGKRKECEEE